VLLIDGARRGAQSAEALCEEIRATERIALRNHPESAGDEEKGAMAASVLRC
jgi:hypothetical protein